MSIQELEALLEATRQKIADQGRIADARLLEKERELEQAVIDAHLDAENEFVFNPKIQQKQYAKVTLPIWGKNAIGLSRSLPHPVYYDAPTQDLGDIVMPQAEQATSNCKKCRVVIKNGGDWGYCTCCYEETRAEEEQEDE